MEGCPGGNNGGEAIEVDVAGVLFAKRRGTREAHRVQSRTRCPGARRHWTRFPRHLAISGVGRDFPGASPDSPQSTTQNHNAFASVPNTMAHTEAPTGTHGAPLSPAAKTKGTQILSVGQWHLPLTLAGTGSRSPGIPRRSRSPKHITPSETAVPQACPHSSLCMVLDLVARARGNSRHLSRADVTNAKLDRRRTPASLRPQATTGVPPTHCRRCILRAGRCQRRSRTRRAACVLGEGTALATRAGLA